MEVKIRFNTRFPKDSDKKWRVIVDGTQHLVDDVEVNCKSWTSVDEINTALQGEPEKIETKYHISCFPKKFEIISKKNQKKAILK